MPGFLGPLDVLLNGVVEGVNELSTEPDEIKRHVGYRTGG